MRVLLAALALSLAPPPTPAARADADVAFMRAASVLVDTKEGTGSGVLFKNGKTTFVWTDAHVVADSRKVETVIDPATGLPRVRVTFGDVRVKREVAQGGRKVGEDSRLARVVRYSEDEDVALLAVREEGFGVASADFSAGVPAAGDAVWHVGSMKGERGLGSVSRGVVAATGRLRRDSEPSEESGVVCDQVSLVALPGSSGGGVFDARSGRCLGLVTETLAHNTPGAIIITPARRLRAFAKRTGASWAVDANVPVPADLGTVSVDALTLPKEWRAPAPAPKPMPPAAPPRVIVTLPPPGRVMPRARD